MKTDKITIRLVVGLLIRCFLFFVFAGACGVAIVTLGHYFKHGEWAYNLDWLIRALIGAGIYSSFVSAYLLIHTFLFRRRIRREKEKD
ncbi:hypothetical protein CFN16_15565 [Pseudomonas fluorescens]|uniref:Lipoprotein n=1 Tax=Pseudomonas fluorescens TaxID=294 RepID=A0A345UYD5_PSEFL|nr:hypothetical protein CFN16_15565 [Pseudomonas fluorescens]